MMMYILIAIGIVVSATCHLLIKNFKLAVMLSAVISTAIPQLLDYIERGFLDAFFPVAVVMCLIMYSGISFAVGAIIKGIKQDLKARKNL